jgi:hypothetical protein
MLNVLMTIVVASSEQASGTIYYPFVKPYFIKIIFFGVIIL